MFYKSRKKLKKMLEEKHKNNAIVSHAHSILTVLKSDWIVLFCQVSFGQELPDEDNQP